jgi:hypothetical protein
LARYCLARQIQTDEDVSIAGRDLYGLTTREVFGTRGSSLRVLYRPTRRVSQAPIGLRDA